MCRDAVESVLVFARRDQPRCDALDVCPQRRPLIFLPRSRRTAVGRTGSRTGPCRRRDRAASEHRPSCRSILPEPTHRRALARRTRRAGRSSGRGSRTSLTDARARTGRNARRAWPRCRLLPHAYTRTTDGTGRSLRPSRMHIAPCPAPGLPPSRGRCALPRAGAERPFSRSRALSPARRGPLRVVSASAEGTKFMDCAAVAVASRGTTPRRDCCLTCNRSATRLRPATVPLVLSCSTKGPLGAIARGW